MRGWLGVLPKWWGRGSRPARVRAPSHALARVRAAALPSLLALLSAAGCNSDGIDVRAIWVESAADARLRRIHVYEGGEERVIEVAGKTEEREFVRLGPRGRGVYVRLGVDTNDESVGAWLSLVDGRRVVMEQPSLSLNQYP